MTAFQLLIIFSWCVISFCQSELSCAHEETNLQDYISMFRTEEQQREFEKSFFKMRDQHLVHVNTAEQLNVAPDTCTSETDCLDDNVSKPPKQIWYNSCCKTVSSYKNLTTAFDFDSKNVNIVQMDSLHQYFYTEDCSTIVQDCPCKCKCTCLETTATALVTNPKATQCLQMFMIDNIIIKNGNCKCLNKG